MMSDRLDTWVKDAVYASVPEPNADVKARAVEAMAMVRPARGLSHRWVLAAVGAMALIGLGFVPIPLGKATGALDRAIAAAEEATAVHVLARMWGDDGEWMLEEWSADDGFWRREIRQDGKPGNVELVVGGWELSVTPDGRIAEEIFSPTSLHPADPYDRKYFEKHLDHIRYLARINNRALPDIQVREWREATLWGGTVDMVEAEWTAEDVQAVFSLMFHTKGTRILVSAEIDSATGRLLSVREYELEGRRWQPTYEATYDWDIEIPEDLKQVELPNGAKLTRYTWWENRAQEVLAQADTRDWTVTLHAIDIKRNGDIVLSLSRVETPDGQMPSVYNMAPPLIVEALGSGGEGYSQDNSFSCYNARHSGYWTTTLMPENPQARPRSITLTIWPYRESPSEDQCVTFRNVSLPPRQNTNDLFAAETEVIRY